MLFHYSSTSASISLPYNPWIGEVGVKGLAAHQIFTPHQSMGYLLAALALFEMLEDCLDNALPSMHPKPTTLFRGQYPWGRCMLSHC